MRHIAIFGKKFKKLFKLDQVLRRGDTKTIKIATATTRSLSITPSGEKLK